MKKNELIRLADNVNLYIIPCSIFKTASINIFIPCELNENYTYHALFPQVLKRGTVSYPDQRSIEILMQELYGANFGASIRKYGNKQIISFSMDIADKQYISSNENLFSYAADFLYGIMFDPVTENGLFRQEYVLQEAFNLKQQIMSIINDKYEYSLRRLYEEMDSGKPYVKCEYGDINELDSIDPQKLFDVYKDVITGNMIDIFVAGDVDSDEICSVFTEKIKFSDRKAPEPYKAEVIIPDKVHYAEEALDVKQGKLNIGYRTNITASDPDYFKLLMFNAVFGGTVNSKLFMNVREKASLCYSISSSIDKFNGIMTVCTGIMPSKREKAYEIIKKQFDEIMSGNVTDFEYDSAVKDFATRTRMVNDSAYSLINFYYGNRMAGLDITPEEYAKRIAEVKKEDIPEIASRIYEDTVYFLTSKGEADV